MRAIPIFRGSHLAPYLDVLHEIGVPVEQRLSRAGLPCRDTVRIGSYLPLQRTVEFLDACAREEGIDELALRGALGSTEASLVPEFSRTLRAATTLRAAMRTVCSLAALEASCVGWRMETGAATARRLR